MTKIYTKTGDKGQTGLWGGQRVSKNHPRVRAYGEIDELNSFLGTTIAFLPGTKNFAKFRRSLLQTQEELFVLGSILATPADHAGRLPAPFDRGVPAQSIARMESEIDQMTKDLEPLKKFILPGGSLPGSFLHLSRTVCRRAEREVISLSERESIPENSVVYLNRLSDFFFTAARWANKQLEMRETQWEGLS